MAATASTDSYSQAAVDQALHNLLVTFYGSWSHNPVGTEYVRYGFDWGLGVAMDITGPNYTADNSFGFATDDSFDNAFAYTYQVGTTYGGYNTDNKLVADATYAFRAHLTRFAYADGTFLGTLLGGSISFKSNSVTATAATPTVTAGPTASTATISCDYHPNTNESTATVWLEYRKYGDSTWILAGSQDTGKSGYGSLNIARALTGLLGSTTYE